MYPKNYDYPSPNFWTPAEVESFAGHVRVADKVVMHKTEGPLTASINWLRLEQGANSVSCHVVIDYDGTRYYLVDKANIAWHAYTKPGNQLDGRFRALWGLGNENFDSVGIELVGMPDEAVTEAQYRSAAEYIVEIGVPRDRLHMVEHRELSRVKSDPQSPPTGFQWGQLLLYATQLAKPAPPAPAPPQPDSDYFPQTGFYIGGGFQDLWHKYGLEVCGYPISTEYQEAGVTYQDCENVIMQWQPGLPARIGAGIRKYKYHS